MKLWHLLLIIILVLLIWIFAIFLVLSLNGIALKDISLKDIPVISNLTNINIVLNADNYEKLSTEYSENHRDDDELYYYTYAVLYYTMSSAFTNPDDENAMYKDIYGKTINQLIEEGKTLMANNNITVEQYKKSLTEIDSSINELNNAIDEFNAAVAE